MDPANYNSITLLWRFDVSVDLLGNLISFSIEIPGALPFTSKLVQSLVNIL